MNSTLLFTECRWDNNSVTCPNEETTRRVFQFLRQAILDKHVYIHKAYCFQLRGDAIDAKETISYRDKNFGDSYIEILKNLADKVFIKPGREYTRMYLSAGENTLLNNNFVDEDSKPVECLYTNPYIITSFPQNAYIEVKCIYNCGYRSIEYNSTISEDLYFPSYTDHSLQEFVRVIPSISGHRIQLRYYNGMTPSMFVKVLHDYFVYCESENNLSFIRKDELKWIQSL